MILHSKLPLSNLIFYYVIALMIPTTNSNIKKNLLNRIFSFTVQDFTNVLPCNINVKPIRVCTR